jgi:hypothetical protein
MPTQRYRLSIRRWLILIAIASSYLGACHWAEGWRPVFRHASALAEFERVRQRYDEGRLTCDLMIDASRSLMNAQLDLTPDRQSRINAIQAHLRQIDVVLQVERNDLHCYRGGNADVAEAEQMREEDEALLAKEKGLIQSNPRDGKR